jgi:hypothetical protein
MGEKSGLVNYSTFCDYIDSVFGEAANPTDVIGNSKSTAVSQIFHFKIIVNMNINIELHRIRNGGYGQCFD